MQYLPRMAMALFLSAWPLSYATAQHLRCNPCDHGYGQVQIGASKQYVFQLTNTGTRTLHILSNRKDYWNDHPHQRRPESQVDFECLGDRRRGYPRSLACKSEFRRRRGGIPC